jgi:hypothetical protein
MPATGFNATTVWKTDPARAGQSARAERADGPAGWAGEMRVYGPMGGGIERLFERVPNVSGRRDDTPPSSTRTQMEVWRRSSRACEGGRDARAHRRCQHRSRACLARGDPDARSPTDRRTGRRPKQPAPDPARIVDYFLVAQNMSANSLVAASRSAAAWASTFCLFLPASLSRLQTLVWREARDALETRR